ncbi:MAG: ABC transporter substrate-binding protein [Erysipelotrichaceae bacterium]|uniref:ABC transporter substrate-binding protein n=1 Tax=Floccifex sp. TaxID=2815810 RepID=UPI002A7655B0|nr:ABC transporter substrate-binding protein [Floccifex sp.]MDD7281033.1 ABC transporter substrate-binding protein [Erysipelotrichaceae bacterium]MDY2957416.1 ABC transporter substrate-binding protein [Floccifex sp.]
MKKFSKALLATAMSVNLFACSSDVQNENTYKIGICNYVDDASLNQIVANIESQLNEVAKEENINFEIDIENCNADSTVLNQIITDFITDEVDCMVAVATPVAMAMQSATEDNHIPVVFSAVSDPVGSQIVESLDNPGSNLTGTSDYLDTTNIFNLIFEANPDATKIGLLYDAGQDSSTNAIKSAKEYLNKKNIEYVEKTGTTTDEVKLAVDALIQENVDAIFTPTDNTIMTAELSIYETLIDAKIPHYTGADSFALNGAFLGYGVDYANLGKETANMIIEIILDGKDPSNMPVQTFDNGTATINIDTCQAIGFDYQTIEASFSKLCTSVKQITTAESFDDIED